MIFDPNPFQLQGKYSGPGVDTRCFKEGYSDFLVGGLPVVLPIPLLNVVQGLQIVTTSNLDLEGVEPAQKLTADYFKFRMSSLKFNIHNHGFVSWKGMNKI